MALNYITTAKTMTVAICQQVSAVKAKRPRKSTRILVSRYWKREALLKVVGENIYTVRYYLIHTIVSQDLIEDEEGKVRADTKAFLKELVEYLSPKICCIDGCGWSEGWCFVLAAQLCHTLTIRIVVIYH